MTPEEEKIAETEEVYVDEEELTPEEKQEQQERFNQIKAAMLDEYQQREFFQRTINQSTPRKISLSLICAQLLYNFDAVTLSLWGALALFLFALAAFIGLSGNANSVTNNSDGAISGIIAVGVIAFFVITALYFLIAQLRKSWEKVRLLKTGFCSLGYLVRLDDIPPEKSPTAKPAYLLEIAFRDADGMIQNYKFSASNHLQYSHLPVLMVFADVNNPKNITIFEQMPGMINFNTEKNIFHQSAIYFLLLLIPLAEILWFAGWVYYFSL